MSEVVIAAARRTPIGRFLGGFAETPAPDLGAGVVRAALADAHVQPERVDELIFGQARLAGCGPNPARQVGRGAGLPDAVPSFTINKACGSGLKALVLAAQSIRLGEARIGDEEVAADQLRRNSLNHVGKIEGGLLLCHPGMEYDLQQEIAQFILQADQIIASNCVSDFVSFLKRIGSNSPEILLKVPRTTAFWRT